MKPRLSALVYGPSGYGKSWLGSTVPPPRLILDLEGRAQYTPNGEGAVPWDGISPPLELPESPTDTYVVTVTQTKQIDQVFQWLVADQHPFFSIDVDSLMFAQMRTKNELRPGLATMSTPDWGTLLRAMEQLVQSLHDLTVSPASKLQCVVFLAGSTVRDGFHVPMMQGQISSRLPYLVDLAGFLSNRRGEDGSLIRSLVLEPYPEYGIRDVKDGTHRISSTLGGVITDPNFESMFRALSAPEGGIA